MNNDSPIAETFFSVMSLNLRFGLADDGENSWKYRKHAYPELFRTHRPDFLGTQESNRFQTYFVDSLLDRYRFTGMRDPSRPGWQDNIIYYKTGWVCRRHIRFFISETPERESRLPGSKWPRQCSMGLFEKDGKRVVVVNTHFDFRKSVQVRSAHVVMDILGSFSGGLPVIVTGDFNSSPAGPAHKVFTDKGFMDVWEGEKSSTFHGFTGVPEGERIDWILYRGNIRNHSREIIMKKFSRFYPSDHFPVAARFSF